MIKDFVYFLKFSPSGYICFLIILNILLNYFIIKLKYNLDYKIYNLYYTISAVLLYIIIFIGLIIVLRYYAWGRTVDIHLLISNVLHNLRHHLLYVILLINVGIFIIFFIIKLRKYLIKQILKLNLYVTGFLYFNKKYRNPAYDSKYELVFSRYNSKYSLNNLYLHALQYKFISLVKFYYKVISLKDEAFITKRHTYLWGKFIKPINDNIHRILLLFLILYDIKYNNGHINKVFYYLPFYFIYDVWYKIDHFICNTKFIFNYIIWERYYFEEYVLYVGTTDEEEYYFLTYIKNGFTHISNTIEDIMTFYSFLTSFQLLRKFTRDFNYKDNQIYINSNTGETHMRNIHLENYFDNFQ